MQGLKCFLILLVSIYFNTCSQSTVALIVIINISLSNLTLTHLVCYLAASLRTFISVELGKFGKDNESTVATAHANLKTALNLALTNGSAANNRAAFSPFRGSWRSYLTTKKQYHRRVLLNSLHENDDTFGSSFIDSN